MNNFSGITLRNRREEMVKVRASLQRSKDILPDPQSVYAEHIQHCINTYNTMIEVLDYAIAESDQIGTGV